MTSIKIYVMKICDVLMILETKCCGPPPPPLKLGFLNLSTVGIWAK